jgi:mannose-6-phosphate isomerase-like protein (cupin superfamily)
MSIDPGDEIGWEVHEENDQFLRVEAGEGRAQAGSAKGQIDDEHFIPEDWAVIIPAGTWHNVVNSGSQPLKLYSIYSPAEHPPDTVHKTKAEADAAEAAEQA